MRTRRAKKPTDKKEAADNNEANEDVAIEIDIEENPLDIKPEVKTEGGLVANRGKRKRMASLKVAEMEGLTGSPAAAGADSVDKGTTSKDKDTTTKGTPGQDKGGKKEKTPKARKEAVTCDQCGKRARNQEQLEKHIMVVHDKLKPYLCDVCGYGTTLRVKMDLHMATKHNEDKVMSYVCDVCDYKCSNQLHLRAHLQIVHLESLTPFECGVCRYQCRKRASVVKHMKHVHEKRRPFQCTQCDKSFPVNSVLMRHIESVHDKVRPYKCETCGYAFSEKRFMEKHVKAVHEKIRPIACEQCDYRCTTRDTLARHMWHKHERAPRFNCRLCEEKYMRRTDLEKHYRDSHEQMYKAYGCDKCEYATDKKKRLAKHLVMDHTEGPHNKYRILQCKECPETFTQHTKLSKHMEVEHGKKPQAFSCVAVKKPKAKKYEQDYGEIVEDEEFDSNEDMAYLDEDDYDWRPSRKKAPKRKSRLRRMPVQIYVPKREVKDEDDDDETKENEDKTEIVYETTLDEEVDAEGRTIVQGKTIKITKTEGDTQEGEVTTEGRSIKFSVRTRGSTGDHPVEFEIELKDQDQENITAERLQDDTQTVINLLTEGNVVDAILTNLGGERNKDGLMGPPKKRWESKKYLCDSCGFSCSSKSTLATHAMFKHGDLPPRSLSCTQCNYTCDHPTQLTSHRRIIHEEQVTPLECTHCPLQVRTELELDKHLRNIHAEEKPFVCNHCTHRFNKKSNMVKHMRMVHEKQRPFGCDECAKAFSDKRDLAAHVDSIHRGLKPFECNYCDYKCARKKNLKVHIINIHGEKGVRPMKPSYECGQCGHVAKHRRLLEQHIRSVHEITVKEFQCGLCDYKSSTKLSVDRHMQSHTKERRSLTAGECSMCGEAFTNSAKLVTHMRNAHGTIEKTYQCESCEYRGATHSALRAHMRAVHDNVRKHRCEYCEFTSFASSALKRHMLAIHEKRKPFGCDQCTFKTSYKESLELHLANKHKESGVPEHLAIKAMNKKLRKADKLRLDREEPQEGEIVTTTEFVVTDATEEALAAQTIVSEAITTEDITTETIAAEAIIL